MTRRYILQSRRGRKRSALGMSDYVQATSTSGTFGWRVDMSDNKMERQNGEVGHREKTMRGLKNPDSPMLKGYQIFHNYIRTHEGLDGKTPAEAAGITVEGENK
jgi:hypothetical protein